MASRKPSQPHDFRDGDRVRINQAAWEKSLKRAKWTSPEREGFIAGDTYRIVQAYATNPFVAVISDKTGKRLGLSVRVLEKF